MLLLKPYKIYIGAWLLLTVAACSLNGKTETPPIEDTAPAIDSLHYLALGDSYTIGERVPYEARYPIQLARQLQAEGILLTEPTIIARTGWNTTQLKNAIAAAELRPAYDLVSLLIGVNNQYQNMPIERYETEFRELLGTALRLAGGDTSRVFVLSIPDYAYTPFGQSSNPARISRELDAYNTINQAISQELGIARFDITPISRQGLAQPELVAPDRLHPSGEMYRRWVMLFFDFVKARLES